MMLDSAWARDSSKNSPALPMPAEIAARLIAGMTSLGTPALATQTGAPASAAATSFRYEAPALTFFCSAFMSSSAMAALLRWTRGTLSAAPSAVSRQAAGPGPLALAKLGPADLAADRFRQLADELDLARVLVGRGDRLHVRLQLRGQRVGRLPAP